MRKFWLICWNDYRGYVFRKRFILLILSLPILGAVYIGIAMIMLATNLDIRPIGYMDLSGQISPPERVYPKSDPNRLLYISYPSEDQARKAIQDGKIQAYFIIQPDYLETGNVKRVTESAPSVTVQELFSSFLRASLISGQPKTIQARLIQGSDIETREKWDAHNSPVEDLTRHYLPLANSILLAFIMTLSGGYLMQAVHDEQANRVIEIIMTSVRPAQLMAAKIVGGVLVGLTQLLLWGGPFLFIYLNIRQNVPIFQQMSATPQVVWLIVLTILPAFITTASIMTAAGAGMESDLMSFVFLLFGSVEALPIILAERIVEAPNTLMARVFSFFPLTAHVTLPLRASITPLPTWEIVLSLIILYGFCVLSVWLSYKIFCACLIWYKQPSPIKKIKTKIAQKIKLSTSWKKQSSR